MSAPSSLLRRTMFLAMFLMTVVAAPAWAQCGPDGLDLGPCCQTAPLTLPQFPPVTQDIRFICFSGCQPRIDGRICVDIGPPIPVMIGAAPICGVYTMRFTIRTCAAAPRVLWTGTIRAHYARNWMEQTSPAPPPNTEVWRFLLNGDLVPSSFLVQQFGNNNCVVPRCFFSFQRVHFWGYIDYARDCQTGQFAAAWALKHGCDNYEHGPGSLRPGVFHPDDSYVFLGPSAGFVTFPAIVPPPSVGPIIQEDVRRNGWETAPAICRFEERVEGGVFQTIREFCPCALPGQIGPPQYIESLVEGGAVCGSSFVTDTAAPPPITQQRIGSWTIGTAFPGSEFLLLDEGFLRYTDGCTGTTSPQYFKGVETIGGFPAFTFAGAPLGRQFEDYGSANRSPASPTPVIGIPYISFYILNLNLP